MSGMETGNETRCLEWRLGTRPDTHISIGIVATSIIDYNSIGADVYLYKHILCNQFSITETISGGRPGLP